MSRLIGVSLAAVLALLLVAGAVSAQQPGPPLFTTGPTWASGASAASSLSEPGGGNNDPAVQYFLRTIPEQERRANTQIFTGAIGDLEQRALTPTAPAAADADLFRPLPTTGLPPYSRTRPATSPRRWAGRRPGLRRINHEREPAAEHKGRGSRRRPAPPRVVGPHHLHNLRRPFVVGRRVLFQRLGQHERAHAAAFISSTSRLTSTARFLTTTP